MSCLGLPLQVRVSLADNFAIRGEPTIAECNSLIMAQASTWGMSLRYVRHGLCSYLAIYECERIPRYVQGIGGACGSFADTVYSTRRCSSPKANEPPAAQPR